MVDTNLEASLALSIELPNLDRMLPSLGEVLHTLGRVIHTPVGQTLGSSPLIKQLNRSFLDSPFQT